MILAVKLLWLILTINIAINNLVVKYNLKENLDDQIS